MHVHTEIDVRNQKPACKTFKFIPFAIGIDAAENDIAAAKGADGFLPFHAAWRDLRIRVDAFDDALRDLGFGAPYLHIFGGAADQSVQVLFFNNVIVHRHELTDAKMSELLNDVGTASTKSDNACLDGGEHLIVFGT